MKFIHAGTQDNPKKLFVWLHGYGSDMNDLLPLSEYFADIFPDTLFLSIQAPFECADNPWGGYQWFSTMSQTSLSPEHWIGHAEEHFPELFTQLNDARSQLKKFIETQLHAYNLTESDLIIAGFSQGAAIAIDLGLSLANPSTVLAFSGWFFNDSHLTIQSKPRILLCHGKQDPVVPVAAAKLSQTALKTHGIDSKVATFTEMDHAIWPEVIQTARKFLTA